MVDKEDAQLQEIKKMMKEEVRAELRKLGLPVHGIKAAIIFRLSGAYDFTKLIPFDGLGVDPATLIGFNMRLLGDAQDCLRVGCGHNNFTILPWSNPKNPLDPTRKVVIEITDQLEKALYKRQMPGGSPSTTIVAASIGSVRKTIGRYDEDGGLQTWVARYRVLGFKLREMEEWGLVRAREVKVGRGAGAQKLGQDAGQEARLYDVMMREFHPEEYLYEGNRRLDPKLFEKALARGFGGGVRDGQGDENGDSEGKRVVEEEEEEEEEEISDEEWVEGAGGMLVRKGKDAALQGQGQASNLEVAPFCWH